MALTAVGYFLLARASVHFGLSDRGVSAFWPAAGLATVAAIKGGRRTLAGTLLGAFASAWFDTPWLGAAGLAVGATTAAWLGREIFHRVLVGSEWLNTQRETVGFLVVAAVAPLGAILIGGSVLVELGCMPIAAAPALAQTWWLGDALGILVAGPACLTIGAWLAEPSRITPRSAALGGIMVMLLAAALVGLIVIPGGRNLIFLLLLLPVIAYLLAGENAVKLTPVIVVTMLILLVRFWGWALSPGSVEVSFAPLGIFLVLFSLVCLLLASFDRRRLLGWSGVVLVGGFCANSWLFSTVEQERRMLAEQRVSSQMDGVRHDLQERMQTYIDTLRGGASMLSITSAPLSRAQWHNYVSSLRLFDEYPGVHGVGVVYPVTTEMLPTFQALRAEARRPELRIHPVAEGLGPLADGQHYVIGLIEPLESNGPALGLDLATESKRRETAELARDTGMPQITRPIRLVQDQRSRPGFLLMVPVYAAGHEINTVAQRRAAFQCWVYSPFVYEEFIHGALGTKQREFTCSLFEGSYTAPSDLLYADAAAPSTFDQTASVLLAQYRFTVGLSVRPGTARFEQLMALLAASGLAFVTVLLAGLILNLQGFAQRANEIAEGRTSDLKLANQQLEVSNESIRAANLIIHAKELEARKLALVATSTNNSVILTDAAGRIEWSNAGFTRVTGYTQAEALGRTSGSLLQGPETDPISVQRFREGLQTQRAFTAEVQNYTKDRRRYWASVEIQPVFDEAGRLVNYMGISTDITRLKQAAVEIGRAKERAEAANQAKSAFLGNISHELRTPLNVILGNLQLLVQGRLGPLDDRQMHSLQRTKENSAHLLSLINDLLDLTKAESGKLTLELAAVDVTALCEACLEMHDGQAALKEIRLIKNFHHRTPAIAADPLRLKQILINLLSNAVKFTPAHGTITLRTQETASPPEIVFTVTDTGKGVAPADRDRIFQEFEQGSATGTSPALPGGTGLGLPIARRLAEMHGGSLELSCEPGHASEFIVRLPVRAPVLAAKPPPITPPVPAKPERPGDFLILAVEDYPANLEILSAYLELEGYRVAQATHGEAAIAQALALQPNLILMDVRMPGIDGLEATRRLKADPRTAEIPVVMLTAFARLSDATQCFETGAVGYLSKPVDFAALDAMIATHLRIRA